MTFVCLEYMTYAVLPNQLFVSRYLVVPPRLFYLTMTGSNVITLELDFIEQADLIRVFACTI